MKREDAHSNKAWASPTQGPTREGRGANGTWSDLDLDSFHDGEMEQERAAALGQALREDAPAVRRARAAGHPARAARVHMLESCG